MPRPIAAFLGGCALLLSARAAHAGDGESALSVSLGWATYSTPDDMAQTVTPDVGGALGIVYERGFSEAMSWRVGLAGGGFYKGGEHGGATGAGWLEAGLVYRFDVLKYVPYVEGGIGGVVAGGGPIATDVHPVLELGGGLDVLRSRSRSWGVEARLGSFAGSTTVLTIGLRGTARWGFF